MVIWIWLSILGVQHRLAIYLANWLTNIMVIILLLLIIKIIIIVVIANIAIADNSQIADSSHFVPTSSDPQQYNYN